MIPFTGSVALCIIKTDLSIAVNYFVIFKTKSILYYMLVMSQFQRRLPKAPVLLMCLSLFVYISHIERRIVFLPQPAVELSCVSEIKFS